MGPMNVTVPMVHQFTVKERSVTNFCYKYSVTENGKWNHAQENEETILKTAEHADNIPLANQRKRDASNIRDALAVFFTIPEGRTLGSGNE